jgi:hypothetical protein
MCPCAHGKPIGASSYARQRAQTECSEPERGDQLLWRCIIPESATPDCETLVTAPCDFNLLRALLQCVEGSLASSFTRSRPRSLWGWR